MSGLGSSTTLGWDPITFILSTKVSAGDESSGDVTAVMLRFYHGEQASGIVRPCIYWAWDLTQPPCLNRTEDIIERLCKICLLLSMLYLTQKGNPPTKSWFILTLKLTRRMLFDTSYSNSWLCFHWQEQINFHLPLKLAQEYKETLLYMQHVLKMFFKTAI